MRTPVSLGVVGIGSEGARLARAFDDLPNVDLRWLFDSKASRRLEQGRRFPLVRWADDLSDMLEDDTLDAIAIATPSETHYDLAMRALDAEKHVFVNRPLALRGEEARRIVADAHRRSRVLMVADGGLSNSAVWKLKECIQAGMLGDIYYIDAACQVHGGPRRDENALWHLGPSALALLLGLLDDQPIDVSARGDAYVREGIPDVVSCYLRFATGIVVTLHLSWLDPRGVNRVTVVGASGTAVVDFGDVGRKLTIHNTSAPGNVNGKLIGSRIGDVVSPQLPEGEPLYVECERFVRMIGTQPSGVVSGAEAVAVVEVLEALQRSLDTGGLPETLDGSSPVSDFSSRPLLVALPGEKTIG